MLFKVTEIGYSKWTKCLTLYPRLSFIPFDWTVKEIVKKCLYRPCFSSVALYVVGPFCFPSHRQSKMSLLYVSKRVWNDTKRKMIDLLCSMLQTLNLNLDDHLAISEQKNKGRIIRTLNSLIFCLTRTRNTKLTHRSRRHPISAETCLRKSAESQIHRDLGWSIRGIERDAVTRGQRTINQTVSAHYQG